jgi:hypothetical protein
VDNRRKLNDASDAQSQLKSIFWRASVVPKEETFAAPVDAEAKQEARNVEHWHGSAQKHNNHGYRNQLRVLNFKLLITAHVKGFVFTLQFFLGSLFVASTATIKTP